MVNDSRENVNNVFSKKSKYTYIHADSKSVSEVSWEVIHV